MNKKTTYLIPAFAAVFVLMFAFVPTLALAEYGNDMHDKWCSENHKIHKVIEVDGFVGSIQVTEDTDRQVLKDQATVSLSEAADGLDVMGGHIGIVTNENDDKYLVWILKSIQKDSESETATVTIYVVDVSDADNTTIITKEFDRSKWDDKFNHDDNKCAKIMEKIQQKLSEPIGDVDATRIAFVEKLQELKAALENGNSERASKLRDELKDLRSELGNIKSYLK
ncbi:MAG: hypothetical protein ACRBB5_00855 [Nitrosopumilus sp.]